MAHLRAVGSSSDRRFNGAGGAGFGALLTARPSPSARATYLRKVDPNAAIARKSERKIALFNQSKHSKDPGYVALLRSNPLMNRSIVALVVCTGLGLTIAPAWAGPCSSAIAQLEGAARRSATNLAGDLTLPQTVGAQLGHQPTPGSIEQAQQQAHSIFAATLARAKGLDRKGNRADCMQAVHDARNMVEFN